MKFASKNIDWKCFWKSFAFLFSLSFGEIVILGLIGFTLVMLFSPSLALPGGKIIFASGVALMGVKLMIATMAVVFTSLSAFFAWKLSKKTTAV